jgi:hypothetical protein
MSDENVSHEHETHVVDEDANDVESGPGVGTDGSLHHEHEHGHEHRRATGVGTDGSPDAAHVEEDADDIDGRG